MGKSKSDIGNNAIRIFLQSVGKTYDKKRGITDSVSGQTCKKKLLKIFNNKCAYCNCNLVLNKKNSSIKSTSESKEITIDHLIPMNRKCLGLDSWGNIVPSCLDCNRDKHDKDWKDFIKSVSKSKEEADSRIKKIDDYIVEMKYNPNLEMHEIVGNLYEDVSEVAQTLINLRIKHANEYIEKIDM